MNIYSGETIDLLQTLLKTFNKNIELKSEIEDNIRTTKGGEKLSWIKKWNSLFVKKWRTKNK